MALHPWSLSLSILSTLILNAVSLLTKVFLMDRVLIQVFFLKKECLAILFICTTLT